MTTGHLPDVPEPSDQLKALVTVKVRNDVAALVAEATVDRSYQNPYVAGVDDDAKIVFVGSDVPEMLDDGHGHDFHSDAAVAWHEISEWYLMTVLGLIYDDAHSLATYMFEKPIVCDILLLDWDGYQHAYDPYVIEDEAADLVHVSPTLFMGPYLDDASPELLASIRRAQERTALMSKADQPRDDHGRWSSGEGEVKIVDKLPKTSGGEVSQFDEYEHSDGRIFNYDVHYDTKDDVGGGGASISNITVQMEVGGEEGNYPITDHLTPAEVEGVKAGIIRQEKETLAERKEQAPYIAQDKVSKSADQPRDDHGRWAPSGDHEKTQAFADRKQEVDQMLGRQGISTDDYYASMRGDGQVNWTTNDDIGNFHTETVSRDEAVHRVVAGEFDWRGGEPRPAVLSKDEYGRLRQEAEATAVDGRPNLKMSVSARPDSGAPYKIAVFDGEKNVGTLVLALEKVPREPGLGGRTADPFVPAGWVQGVVVDPSYRRQGIATAMYRAAEKAVGGELTPSRELLGDAQHFWSTYRPGATDKIKLKKAA